MYEFGFMNVFTIRAVFSAQGSGQLPEYLGSTIRGVLGHCFRDFVCNTRQIKCFRCEKRETCLYVKSFSNTGGEGGAINPYVLHARSYGKTEWRPGDEIAFDLTLFGRAAGQAGLYVDALRQMERKGWGVQRIPFQLLRLVNLDAGSLIYADGQSWLRNITPGPLRVFERRASAALIAFDTPARIVSGKELFTSLPFEVLIHFLVRRLSLLTQVCTDYEMDWDREGLLEAAAGVRLRREKWRNVDFERYSINQAGNKLELPARIGWALYEGNLDKFTPILEAGRFFHVGKNTTIGFGHYEITYDGGKEDGE